MMTGAIREIRRLYPNAKITLVVYPVAFEVAEICPYVDEVIPNNRATATNWNILTAYYGWNVSFARQLLERKFDICYAFPHYPDTLFLMYMSGANVRITYDFPEIEGTPKKPYADIPVSYAVHLANYIFPRHRFGRHAADISFSLVDNLLNAPVENRRLEIWYSPFDKAVAKNILQNVQGKIYAVCMGGINLAKRYPPQMYAKVLEMIFSEEHDANFVILGGGQNDLKCAEILKNSVSSNCAEKILDLVGKINYRQSAAVLTMCDMYIGNDTGTMHVAAAVNCPVLMPNCFPVDIPFESYDMIKLFSPYNVPSVIIQPEHALPECAADKTHNPYGCKANQPHCITQIKPETVFTGFKLLKKRIEQKITEPFYFH